MTLVAVVEHDEETRKRLVRVLRADNFDVLQAEDGLEALRTVFDSRPDVALVDLRPSEVNGFELIRILRAACDLPIVALSDDTGPSEVVGALDAGADDVVIKNCEAIELLARVRAAMRRRQRPEVWPSAARQIRTGALEIDRDAQIVKKHGVAVQLTGTEYRLLDALAARLGETAPHRYLLSTVWGDEYVDYAHYLRVYVGYLRQKLEDDPAAPHYLVNEWGIGYRLARIPVEIPALQPVGA